MKKFACVFVVFVFLALAVAACSKDAEPEKTVVAFLERAMIVSDSARLQAALDDPESEAGRAFFSAKDDLSELFAGPAVEKRILATFRPYGAKGWETLKTIENEHGIFVVVFLRSDSQTAGEPVDKRPGWRKALFKVQRDQGGCKVADLDRVIEQYGDKPLFKGGGDG